MSTQYEFTLVATFDIRGMIPGEYPLNNWHMVRVYRTTIGGTSKYSVHYDINRYHFDADNQVIQDEKISEQDDFEDGAAADAKFQHSCLKAFSNVMVNRNRSY